MLLLVTFLYHASAGETLYLTSRRHTSGSTGLPKPLIWTQESVARQHNMSALPAPNGSRSLDSLYLGKRVLNTLPPFHVRHLPVMERTQS